ncbi:Crp/Fnr family transcriptional regulator [Acidiphilium acidophilum]|uniref:Crp/Fnr family transcriptional regulator n=1 Tax=Acidiphilium acidophilum TaxID=76588 RepID=A0AAW9DY06_ACIAO|nr:Crp/Fnr family transcriptional regulator [Acidiphilium acidophilum]MDX5932990.1 Crp/Fnr family transcriptional regulator [Acidiphilium acidophilum]GBQ17612.1 cAMP-binding transcriptional regulator [Acidiphilium acidophilum DSM 700]
MLWHDAAARYAAGGPVPGAAIERTASMHCGTCAARHVGLCDALSADGLAELADAACWCSLPRGCILMAEGEPGAHFINVSHGTVRLSKDMQDGRRQVIGFVSTGAFVGLGAEARYSFTATTLDEVRFCRFDRTGLRELFLRYPVLEQRLLAAACNELALAQGQMLLLGRKPARERLATFLIDWSSNFSNREPTALVVLPMCRGDIADYLGLTIETVSRCLTAMRKQCLIAIDAEHNISIIDRTTLQAIGSGATN